MVCVVEKCYRIFLLFSRSALAFLASNDGNDFDNDLAPELDRFVHERIDLLQTYLALDRICWYSKRDLFLLNLIISFESCVGIVLVLI